MSAHPLPMDPDDERLWLIGLFGFLVGSVALFGIWTMIPTGTASFQVSGASDEIPVNVTVEKSVGDGREVVGQETVRDRLAVVFPTSEPGWYVVTLSTEEASCERSVSLTRENNKLKRYGPSSDTDSCPAEFSVEMRPI